ncbi:MAG: stage III sporulation protein AG [Lachnospiraceae bacterium]|nr:stage III sporulation protein AG [Lachnospiraceae bacterium]
MNKKVKELKKENFVVILLVGILLLVIAWPVSEKEDTQMAESGISDTINGTITDIGTVEERESNPAGQDWVTYAEFLEDTLEEVLSTMEGAGKVKVMITLESSGESIVEKDVTTGIDASTQVNADGGSHNTSGNEKTGETVYVQQDRVSYPYVKQIISPRVAGVVVSAQGGDNLTINKNITEAIQALFGIDAHKIKIIKMSSRE